MAEKGADCGSVRACAGDGGTGGVPAHRPKTYEGGASVTYTDQDGTYELLVGTSLNNIEDKQPEEKRTLSLSVDETSYLPAMLGVYRNGTPVAPEAFLAKVERCILEAFPNENGALDIAGAAL